MLIVVIVWILLFDCLFVSFVVCLFCIVVFSYGLFVMIVVVFGYD